jgi:hypothetical protein
MNKEIEKDTFEYMTGKYSKVTGQKRNNLEIEVQDDDEVIQRAGSPTYSPASPTQCPPSPSYDPTEKKETSLVGGEVTKKRTPVDLTFHYIKEHEPGNGNGYLGNIKRYTVIINSGGTDNWEIMHYTGDYIIPLIKQFENKYHKELLVDSIVHSLIDNMAYKLKHARAIYDEKSTPSTFELINKIRAFKFNDMSELIDFGKEQTKPIFTRLF